MNSATRIAPHRRRADGEWTDIPRLGKPDARRRRDVVPVCHVFPAVRPFSGPAATKACERTSPLDAPATATGWVLGEGLKDLDRTQRKAILERWFRPEPGNGAPLVIDDGCNVRIGATVATGQLRSALLRWLPCSTTDIAALEDGLFAARPVDALTLLLRPPTIWSLEEAATAGRLFPKDRAFEPERFVAIERYGRSRVGGSQCSRVREAAERLTATLPSAGFPLARSIVVAGCRLVSDDADRCAAAAARQLARFATSVRVTCSA